MLRIRAGSGDGGGLLGSKYAPPFPDLLGGFLPCCTVNVFHCPLLRGRLPVSRRYGQRVDPVQGGEFRGWQGGGGVQGLAVGGACQLPVDRGEIVVCRGNLQVGSERLFKNLCGNCVVTFSCMVDRKVVVRRQQGRMVADQHPVDFRRLPMFAPALGDERPDEKQGGIIGSLRQQGVDSFLGLVQPAVVKQRLQFGGVRTPGRG